MGISIAPPTPDADKSEHVKANKIITSGSLMQLSLWEELGGYDEKLFIDEVDHEYCYRAVSKGYKVICFKNIILDHKLVQKKCRLF